MTRKEKNKKLNDDFNAVAKKAEEAQKASAENEADAFDYDEKTVALFDGEKAEPAVADNKTEMFVEAPVEVGASSVIGQRKNQEDCIKTPENGKMIAPDGTVKFICVLSDGMGGLSGGEVASKIATENLFADYYQLMWQAKTEPYMQFFDRESGVINDQILALKDSDGVPLRAGATLIAVAVEGNEMHFLNIGDSRIYLIRAGKMLQLTHDQNYYSVLKEKVLAGEITEEEANTHPKREALVSYLGIDDLKIKEINLKPVEMQRGDVVLMCSDGLYRLLSEDEITQIVSERLGNINTAAFRLTEVATNKNYRGQDNTSVILIKFN